MRSVYTACTGAAWLVASFTAVASAADTARGVVYHDVNHNQHRDAGEPALPGVRVSNGVDVVTTDADGRYELAVGDNTILFVLKPRGYRTAMDATLKLPRFYYVHRPAGTPDAAFVFKGVGPTGPLPPSVDFPLYAQQEPERFNVVLFGDPQAYTTEEMTWYLAEVVPELASHDAAFGVALGDLVGDNLDLLEPYNEANAVAPFPWYNVIGNHDLNFMAPTDEDSDATFERVYGPSTYAFQYADAHFIIANNVYWPGFHGLRRDGWAKRGEYEGRLRDDQITFVENYVRGVPHDEVIVVCTHIPLYSPYSREKGQNTPQVARLMEILSDHPHTLSFSGHTHINYNALLGSEFGYRPSEGTRHLHHNVGTVSGSWYHGPRDDRGIPFGTMRDGTPRGYAVAAFDGSDVSIRYQPFRREADHQMVIHVPPVVTRDAAEVRVQANVFNASEESRTRMRLCAGGDWIDMTPQRLTDPGYVAMHERHEREVEAHPERDEASLPKPEATDHHYVATLPALPVGIHVIEVETTDLSGHVYRAYQAFRVIASDAAWQAFDANSSRTPRTIRPPIDNATTSQTADHR